MVYEYLGIVFKSNIQCDFFRVSHNTPIINLLVNICDYKKIAKNENVIDKDGNYIFSLKGKAKYIISNKSIICSCSNIEFFKFTVCNVPFAVLSILLGNLPLHCSAIFFNNIVYAFLGCKGAGKSTLCYSLLNIKSDYLLFGDDAISFSLKNDSFAIHQGIIYLKVNNDIINRFNINKAYLKQILTNNNKYFYINCNSYENQTILNYKLFQLSNNIIEKPICSNELKFYLKRNILSLEFIYSNLSDKINSLLDLYCDHLNNFYIVNYSFDLNKILCKINENGE